MNGTRFTVFAAATLVVAGLGVGTAAYLGSSSALAQTDRLPAAVRWMPADSRFVAHVNVAALLASPLRDEWEKHQTEKSFQELEQFRSATGLDPLSDIDSFAFSSAAGAGGGKVDDWAMAAQGKFNPDALVSSIERQMAKRTESQPHGKLEKTTYGNTSLYVFSAENADSKPPAASHGPHALAFPDSQTALFGSVARVKQMLDAGTSRSSTLVSGALGRYLTEVSDQDTVWLVGDAESGLQRTIGLKGNRQGAPSLPPLKFFSLAARLGQSIDAVAKGEAADPEAARKLADVVRGFVALGSLQTQARPELASLLDTIQIQQTENRVEVSVSLPYETLERLAPSPKKAEAGR